MPVTRYQRKRDLYESVFEQPLLLQNILSHMSAKDGVNLKLTNKQLTKQPRFDDTLSVFMTKKHAEHLQTVHDTKVVRFIKQVTQYLQEFHLTRTVEQRVRQANVVYDFLVENKWFMEINELQGLVRIVERKLIQMIVDSPEEYAHNALYYLSVLFGIEVKARPHPYFLEEIQEYIEDSEGNIVLL